jgi:hypothetical protein
MVFVFEQLSVVFPLLARVRVPSVGIHGFPVDDVQNRNSLHNVGI